MLAFLSQWKRYRFMTQFWNVTELKSASTKGVLILLFIWKREVLFILESVLSVHWHALLMLRNTTSTIYGFGKLVYLQGKMPAYVSPEKVQQLVDMGFDQVCRAVLCRSIDELSVRWLAKFLFVGSKSCFCECQEIHEYVTASADSLGHWFVSDVRVCMRIKLSRNPLRTLCVIVGLIPRPYPTVGISVAGSFHESTGSRKWWHHTSNWDSNIAARGTCHKYQHITTCKYVSTTTHCSTFLSTRLRVSQLYKCSLRTLLCNIWQEAYLILTKHILSSGRLDVSVSFDASYHHTRLHSYHHVFINSFMNFLSQPLCNLYNLADCTGINPASAGLQHPTYFAFGIDLCIRYNVYNQCAGNTLTTRITENL